MLVLEEGGDHTVAAAVVVTLMNNNDDDDSTASSCNNSKTGSDDIISTRTRWTFQSMTNRDNPSITSDTPSLVAARKELKVKEEEIANKMRALEEAEMMNVKKEQEITERMNALDAATAEMVDKVNAMQNEIDHKVTSNGKGEVHDESGESASPATSFNMKCYWCGGI